LGGECQTTSKKVPDTFYLPGFDFLGQTIRRYPNGKVLLRPSKKNVQTFLAKIQEVLRKQGGHCTARELIQTLNLKIKGWTMYHRHACSKRTFGCIDDRIYHMLWRWCRKRHRRKSAAWIRKQYFQSEGDRGWVFKGNVEDRKGTAHPIYLMKAGKVRIIRHVKIRGDANPYDPSWEGHLEERLTRRMRMTFAGRAQIHYLWQEQQGRCVGCGETLRDEEAWLLHHRIRRSHGGGDELSNLQLYHATCHRQRFSRDQETEFDRVSQEAFEMA